jgi:hypothetical protein
MPLPPHWRQLSAGSFWDISGACVIAVVGAKGALFAAEVPCPPRAEAQDLSTDFFSCILVILISVTGFGRLNSEKILKR